MGRFYFDTRDCTRCGGSGQYSYNAMTGSRCFGCDGSGRQLTPAAKRAKKSYDELRNQLAETTVDDIAVGDSVRHGSTHRKLSRVVAIETDQHVVGGVTIRTANGKGMTYTPGYRTIWRGLDADERAQLDELLRNAKGVTEHETD